jgi:hypothetical protein
MKPKTNSKMITPRSKVLVEAAEDYAVTEAELIGMIEKCVCDYYEVSPEQLGSRLRKGLIPRARRMYFMLTLNTVSVKAFKLAQNLNQSHCMVSHAKDVLIDLNQKWFESLAEEYDFIDSMIIGLILKKEKPVGQTRNNFLLELGELTDRVRETYGEPGTINETKDRLIVILNLISAIEKKGEYENLLEALMKITIKKPFSFEELVLEDQEAIHN